MDKVQRLMDAANARVEKLEKAMEEAIRTHQYWKLKNENEGTIEAECEESECYEEVLEARGQYLDAKAQRDWILAVLNADEVYESLN